MCVGSRVRLPKPKRRDRGTRRGSVRVGSPLTKTFFTLIQRTPVITFWNKLFFLQPSCLSKSSNRLWAQATCFLFVFKLLFNNSRENV